MNGIVNEGIRTLGSKVAAVCVIGLLAACGTDSPDGANATRDAAAAAKPVAVATSGAAQPATAPVAATEQSDTTVAAADATPVNDDIETIYQRACVACHLSGAAGAPRSHDAEAWAPRVAKGMDTMVANVVNGLNAMPAKGMCFDCTDAQYRALITYMMNPKP